MYILANAKIIQEDGILENFAVVVEGENISRILPVEEAQNIKEDYEWIDCQDYYLAPGFIDIHSDYIENIVSPRPTSMIDFNIGLKESERILITHGITTMYHSLSLYKDEDFGVKPIRRPDNVKRLIEAINQMHDIDHVIRHRVHARLEINNIEIVDQVNSWIDEDRIHLISFMDHTPGQGQYRDLEVYKKTVKGYQSHLSDEDTQGIIATRQARDTLQLEEIMEIAERAQARGIAVASHDDDTLEKLEVVKKFKATISEFPIHLDVARQATLEGMWTIAGAPNVLMGGSHSGNLSAIEGIMDGSISILCSDYYPSGLIHALYILHRQYNMPLHEVFKMVTLHPAKAVGIDHEAGSIAPNKKADLLLLGVKDGFPAVVSAMVNGKIVYRTGLRK